MSWPFTISLDQGSLDAIEYQTDLLEQLLTKANNIMAMLSDLIAKVATETTDIGALTVFIQGLEDKISAIPGITPQIQAQIDTIFASVDANDKAIVAAMKIGVPPAPAPTVVPPVV
jgi:hypothetical protein